MLTSSATTSLTSGPGAEAAELTEVEGRVWGSWHLYEVSPDDYLRVLSAVLPSLVKELSTCSLVDRFFFIRYVDEKGHHVRLRFRLSDDVSRAAARVTQMVKDMAAESGLTVLPRPFELEVERYGGLDYLPFSLDFFCLSSLAALNWLERYADESRSRQLPVLMGLLTSQAVAFARSLGELTMLLDYFAGWRTRMEAPKQHGDRIFEGQSEQLISLLRLHTEYTLSTVGPQEALVEGARTLSFDTLGLAPKARMEILLSQMHMTANRLGLRNTEESYVTQILQRALKELEHENSGYVRELDARLARQLPTTKLDVLVNRCLEAQ